MATLVILRITDSPKFTVRLLVCGITPPIYLKKEFTAKSNKSKKEKKQKEEPPSFVNLFDLFS
jgi:hypothetical protein